jgi:hypothetical protein
MEVVVGAAVVVVAPNVVPVVDESLLDDLLLDESLPDDPLLDDCPDAVDGGTVGFENDVAVAATGSAAANPAVRAVDDELAESALTFVDELPSRPTNTSVITISATSTMTTVENAPRRRATFRASNRGDVDNSSSQPSDGGPLPAGPDRLRHRIATPLGHHAG